MKSRNTISENEMIARLESDRQLLPPLSISLVRSEFMLGTREVDALLEVSWQGRSAMFAAEMKASSTPKTLQMAVDQITSTDLPAGTYPMVIVPHLREDGLRMLEACKVSGIDMCGNGVVICDDFMAFRSGKPNRYKSTSSIKNVYARNSSMVARALLCKPSFPAVQALLNEVNARNLLVRKYARKPMSQSTVSKCLKSLEEDLIVTRKNSIRLLQAEKLLTALAENYSRPMTTMKVSCKAKDGDTMDALARGADRASLPVVLSGVSSVNRYAVMQRGDVLQVYCPNVATLLEQSVLVETKRFPDIELMEVSDESVFFDSREENVPGVWSASPVQTYLELMSGDKRDKETADQVKDFILSELERRP
jgi:hypothetical protein